MIRIFAYAASLLVLVEPSAAQYQPGYIGPPINPQQIIMEQRYQDFLSRNSATRTLDHISPNPMVAVPQRGHGPVVIMVPDGSARRTKAPRAKRKVSKASALRTRESTKRSSRTGRGQRRSR